MELPGDPDPRAETYVEPPREPRPRPVGIRGFPVEAFNPLLRSLLTWGLVERVQLDDGSQRWELTETARRRLDELTPERRSASSTLAYLDHWCNRCREQRLTHLIDGRYLCEDCERAEAEPLGEVPLRSSRRRPRLLRRAD